MEPIKVYVKEGESFMQAPKSPIDEVQQPRFEDSATGSKPIAACPFSHQLLMLLSLKKQVLGDGKFQFEIHRINVAKPPPEFRQSCLHNVPALVDPNTETSSDHELEMIEYLEEQYPTPALSPPQESDADLQVRKISLELFKKFNQFIKNVTKDNAPLMQSLRALNDYLEKKGTQFIFGNHISTLDTELMPKLHQLRIACSYLRSSDIPKDMTGVWRYLYRAYHCPAFLQWCPSDQEIIIAWTVKAALEAPQMKLSFDEKKNLIKSESRFTFDMPDAEMAKKFSAGLFL